MKGTGVHTHTTIKQFGKEVVWLHTSSCFKTSVMVTPRWYHVSQASIDLQARN